MQIAQNILSRLLFTAIYRPGLRSRNLPHMRKSAATAAVEPRAARFPNVWERAVNSNRKSSHSSGMETIRIRGMFFCGHPYRSHPIRKGTIRFAAPPIPGSAFAVMPILFSACGTDLSMMPLAVIVASTVGYFLPAMNGYCLQLELLMTAWKSDMADKSILAGGSSTPR